MTTVLITETTEGTAAVKAAGLRWVHAVRLDNDALVTVVVTDKGLGYAMEVDGAANWDEASEAIAAVAANPKGAK